MHDMHYPFFNHEITSSILVFRSQQNDVLLCWQEKLMSEGLSAANTMQALLPLKCFEDRKMETAMNRIQSTSQ
jgi:hypothetical protein